MAWTRFMDMHSGGGSKTPYEYIYIEASEDEAVNVFGNLFNEYPYSVACPCCGSNFSVSEYTTLEEATSYEREWNEQSVEDYLKSSKIKVVYASEINPEHLTGNPAEEYIASWDYDEDEEV